MLRQLTLDEIHAAAAVHRAAYDLRLPWLAGRHTPEQDRWYFRERVFPACAVWGALEGATIVGIIAFRDDWIDQLYVKPDAQARGCGTALLDAARSAFPRLHLWAFQRNHLACRFYETRGFVPIRLTDGTANEEKQPDVLYRWHRPALPTARQ
jgi:GNAT superfamily N-acetyltransferase